MSTLDPSLDTTTETPAGSITVPFADVVTSADHKVIGRTLVALSLLGLLTVATVGAVLGVERVDGEETLLDADVIPQLFAALRVGLVEAALLPLLLGVAVYVVPLQLGARALALPRLAAAGVWTWLGGVVLVIIALANGGGPSGTDADMVELYLGGNVLALVGLTAVAVTVATSVLTTRAPGMRLHRVPLFSWSALIAAIGLILVLPVAAGLHVLHLVDVRYGSHVFGGSPEIWTWSSYLYSGPVLGVFAVPAAGAAAELLAVTFGRRLPMRFVGLIGLGLVGTAAFAGIGQQPIIVLPGEWSAVELANFGTKLADLITWALLTLLPVLGVVVVMGLGALAVKPDPAEGFPRPNVTAPFVFAFLGLGIVAAGMLGAAVHGIEDLGLWGTVFEEGAALAVIYGAVITGLGAVAYWFPKASGRLIPQGPLIGLALLGALGAALAAAPYLVAGFADQPANSPVWDYSGPAELWNIATTAGHVLVGLVVLAFAGLALKAWRTGDAAGDDPWGGQTLEWTTASPAPAGNFAETPTVISPEPLLDLKAAPPGSDR